MYRGRKVSVVVPAFNEENLIIPTLESVPDYVDTIFVINDGSTDRTPELVQGFIENDARFILYNKENGGVGSAIKQGYRLSLEADQDITVIMAGDHQMDPQYLPSLLDPIIDGEADYTKGNRLVDRESAKGMSSWRYFGNKLLSMMTKVSSGLWSINDPQNGYTAISNHVFKVMHPSEIFGWYGYCNDMLTRLNMYGFRVMDVDIPARYGEEKSKIRYPVYMYKVSRLLMVDFVMRISYKQREKNVLLFVVLLLITVLASYTGILILLDSSVMFPNAYQFLFSMFFASALTLTISGAFYFFLLVAGAVLLKNKRIQS